MTVNVNSTSHLTSDELAGYLDRRLDAPSLARLEAHMAECAECRAEVVDVSALLESARGVAAPARTVRVTRRTALTWLAAAGVVAIACLPLLQRAVRSVDDSSRVRAAKATPARIEIVGPREGLVSALAVVFTWRPVEGTSTYRLTLTDSSGTALFNAVTSDTSVAPPADVAIRRGSSYLWYVDGLTSDGRTLSSGVHSFSTQR